MKKDVVVGLGEIGLPILKLLSKQNNVVGYDIDKKLMNNVKKRVVVIIFLGLKMYCKTYYL